MYFDQKDIQKMKRTTEKRMKKILMYVYKRRQKKPVFDLIYKKRGDNERTNDKN